jgi:hypothetical protein
LVEALVGDREPLDLIGQELVSSIAQHPDVKLVEDRRILIDGEFGSSGIDPQAERRLRTRRGV